MAMSSQRNNLSTIHPGLLCVHFSRAALISGIPCTGHPKYLGPSSSAYNKNWISKLLLLGCPSRAAFPQQIETSHPSDLLFPPFFLNHGVMPSKNALLSALSLYSSRTLICNLCRKFSMTQGICLKVRSSSGRSYSSLPFTLYDQFLSAACGQSWSVTYECLNGVLMGIYMPTGALTFGHFVTLTVLKLIGRTN